MGKKKVVEQGNAAPAAEKEAAVKTVKKSKRLESGKVFINASYNNTIVTVTDGAGQVIAWASAGSLGFSGPKKATPFASSKVIAALAEKVKPLGLSNIDVILRGVGGGRDSALRSLATQGFAIQSIKDVTPIPHNGPRPRKTRRV